MGPRVVIPLVIVGNSVIMLPANASPTLIVLAIAIVFTGTAAILISLHGDKNE